MEQQQSSAAATGDASVDAAGARVEQKPSWLTRKFEGFYSTRDSIKKHPVWGTMLAGLVLVLTLAASEGYGYVKDKVVGPDEFLVQIAASQKQEFAELRKNLSQIKSSLSDGDREAFSNVQSAVSALESTNSDLIQQLVMAKKENDTLSKVSGQKAGIAGGYDFILTEKSGIRLDATTVLGLREVDNYWGVSVSLTSATEAEPKNERLKSGQSLAYQSASGQACKVSLLSFKDAEIGTASFAVGCT